MTEDQLIAIATLALAALAAIFALAAFFVARRRPADPPPSRAEMAVLLRQEGDSIRLAADAEARGLRQELGQLLGQNHSNTFETLVRLGDLVTQRLNSFDNQLDAAGRVMEDGVKGITGKLNADLAQMAASATTNRDTLRAMMEQKLDGATAAQIEAARGLREELNASFQRMRQAVGETLTEASNRQQERLDNTQRELKALTATHQQAGEQLRVSVEGRLDALRQENAAKLEEVRQTVDEKLQTTLEARLGESFNRVVEQLNKAYEVFGEMRTISSNVGDLKNVLTNPKLRGTFGEVQLAMLLEDFLSPSQYIRDAQVREHSNERVEFAIRLPLSDGEDMLLPVDAKFPREDHEKMLAAIEVGDTLLAEKFRKDLEVRIKAFAKDISKKYINPPLTTERAILFLPTESLFAEVLRMPGLFEQLQRECHVMLAGPTTFAAILHAFQVNHRSMAVARQSSEVWRILSAVRTEFRKYNETVATVAKQLNTAAKTVDSLGTRTRAMDRALKNVEVLPDDGRAARMLGLDGEGGMGDEGADTRPHARLVSDEAVPDEAADNSGEDALSGVPSGSGATSAAASESGLPRRSVGAASQPDFLLSEATLRTVSLRRN